MHNSAISSLFTDLLRLLLRLRYRIDWRGLETLDVKKGVLFLPNHPAEIDPVILIAGLWPEFQPRPLAIEDFYYMPIVHSIMKLARTLPVPNMVGAASEYKRRRVQNTVNATIEGLKEGDNIVLYPAGRLMRDRVEFLGATSAVHDILQAHPDVQICLVRTSGLLGSSFAWYPKKERPDLLTALKSAARWIVTNLIFFVPKRELKIELEMAPKEFPRSGDKLEINRWLEQWYNVNGPEEIQPVSYSLWSKVYNEVIETEETTDDQNPADVNVPDDVGNKVITGIANIARVKPGEVKPNMHLVNELGLDSLSMADVVAWLEEEFQVMDVDPSDLQTVRDVMGAAVGTVRSAVGEPAVKTPETWFDRRPRPPIEYADPTSNIAFNFLEISERLGDLPAVADDITVLSYSGLRVASLVLAEVFSEYDEKHLGVMLPASAGADIVILAALISGKVPVMINWTLGDANLKHVLETSGISRIITSGRFLDKLDAINFDLIGDYVVTLEELKREVIRPITQARAWWRSRGSTQSLGRIYGFNRVSPDDPAVILYTSGSESAPKAVPLTHRNIISNVNAGGEAGKLRSGDIMFGFLPPFHSFGFTITSLMPLMLGLKACYYANPTESRRVAAACEIWRPTCCAGTPTFFAALFKAASPGQLDSLRLMVSGAERAPDELFATAEEFKIEILEGYGITETSPVLTLTPPGQERVGVGQPIGDVEIRIVHQETREPVPQGERGLILAAGSNVFGGYLNRDSSDVFHEMDGKKFYVTGDLGFVDEKGNVTIAGRLKRFVKIGGEMISLPAMETILGEKFPAGEDGPMIAISAVEKDGERPELYLFAATELTRDGANGILKDAGLSNLARVIDVIRVDTIPLLGTGKTDYQELKRMLADREGA